MFKDGVKVDHSNVGGSVAGRDNNFNTNNYVFSGEKGDYMKVLLAKFKEDAKNSERLQHFIEDLDYYCNRRKDDVVGLEQKLRDGERESLIIYAMDFKDRFHRLMYKYQFSEAAQQIMVHLLAEVESRFLNEIYPLICANESTEKINMMLTERLIDPIKEELHENLLAITAQHINGMIYLLTGNCHIKWTK